MANSYLFVTGLSGINQGYVYLQASFVHPQFELDYLKLPRGEYNPGFDGNISTGTDQEDRHFNRQFLPGHRGRKQRSKYD